MTRKESLRRELSLFSLPVLFPAARSASAAQIQSSQVVFYGNTNHPFVSVMLTTPSLLHRWICAMNASFILDGLALDNSDTKSVSPSENKE